MKEHIVSDIPFIFFLYFTFAVVSSVYRQGRFNASGGALITLLITFTALLRTPGVLLVPALLAFGLLHRDRAPASRSRSPFFPLCSSPPAGSSFRGNRITSISWRT
jgi:hypothetical protein